MFKFVCSRLASAAIVIVGVSWAVFLLLHLIPGDPVEAMLGETASATDRAVLRRDLGLDAPLASQWGHFARGLVTLDLGTSLYGRQPIAPMIAERLPYTAVLAVTALAWALVLAVPLGVGAALRAGSVWDTAASVVSLVGVSLPNFLLGPCLIIVFSVWLGWLPIGGADEPRALVLPALCLGTALSAILARMIRGALLQVLDEDYVTAARARGLRESAVILRHALKNAALPILTVIGMQLGALLGGAVITETVFGWPGLGQLTIEAIQRRDYPVVQVCVLVISVSYVLINTLTDLAYAWLDPRINYD